MTLEGFGNTPTEFNNAAGVPVVRHHGQIPPPPPAITWVAPSANATVAGATVGLLVSVTSQVTVTSVDIVDESNGGALIGHASLGTYGWLVVWDSTGTADGARTLGARATDSLGQTSTVTIAVTVRNSTPAPPAIAWVAPALAQTVSATTGFLITAASSLTVTTVEFFVDTVSIGTATHGPFGWLKSWDSTAAPNGTHEVEVHATDSNGQVSTDSRTFTVDNAPPPPGPPTIVMLAPHDVDIVSGTVGLAATPTVSSPATVTRVEFFVDNISVGTGVSNTFGYALAWDSTAATNGTHTIKATVTDSTAQTASVSITVTVNNASQLAITLIAPHGGDTVTGATVGLFANATDNSPNTVTGVQFFANNVLLGSAVTQAGGWLYVWDTTAVTPGTYTLRATATDSTGATASATITITVRATVAPPVVTIAAPSAGAVVSGSAVGLDAGVTSTVAIAGVQFFHDGVLIGTATQSSFGWVTTWDTTSVADGTHLVTAVATDALSQSGQLSITVTVHNAVAVVGVVMPTNSSTNPAVSIDPTFTRESTVGIRNWVAANMAAIKAADNKVLVPPGIYWVEGPVLQNSSVHFKPQDPDNPPVWRRPTVFPYRIKPDLRATIGGVANPAYNPNGRSSQWQFDHLGGEANIPASFNNAYQGGLRPRGDACTITNGSATVIDASITTGDAHREINQSAAIPKNTYVGTVINGVSFLLSSSPTAQVNVNATANGSAVSFPDTAASGTEIGGYDAKVTRSGTQVIGLTALYGAPWTQADVGSIIQYLVESGANGSYQSTVRSVALDGKSLVFDNPVAGSASTREGSEGTVAWCRHQINAGWKVEHQTNDLLSFYVGPPKNHAYGGYADAIEQMVQANMRPIVQFTDTSPVILEGIELHHSNDDWHGAIINLEKSYPVVTEFMRCVETLSTNQTLKDCELHHVWGAAEHGPAHIINPNFHHCGMQCCTGHWDGKHIEGGVMQLSHHSVVDIEAPGGSRRANVLIENLDWGGPQALVSISSPVDGLTIRNVASTNALRIAGTIDSVSGMWASDGTKGFTVPCTDVLLDNFNTDSAPNGSAHAVEATNTTGLTVMNSRTPGITGAFVKSGASTNVTSTGNDGGSGVGATIQKAP